jgi:hypothetical protein
MYWALTILFLLFTNISFAQDYYLVIAPNGQAVRIIPTSEVNFTDNEKKLFKIVVVTLDNTNFYQFTDPLFQQTNIDIKDKNGNTIDSYVTRANKIDTSTILGKEEAVATTAISQKISTVSSADVTSK